MTAEKVASHIQKEMERTLRVLCAEHGARFNGVRVDVVRSTDGKPFKFTAAIIVAAAAGEGK